jgi:HNH endonuclease
MARQRTTPQEFIRRATHIHAGAYDYTSTLFTRMRDPITFRCKQHGNITQSARHHIGGHGCPACNLGSGKHSPAAESKARAAALKVAPMEVKLTQQLVRDWLEYRDGHLYWACKSNHSVNVGAHFGYVDSEGYVSGSLCGFQKREHQLVWLLHMGCLPDEDIDHINGVRTDNRIENLRAVSRAVNMQNLKRARKDSGTGVLGVHQSRTGRFIAQARIFGKVHHLGTRDTVEEAEALRLAFVRQHSEGNTL